MSKTFSEMLIERGIYPGAKKYEKVRPRGIYMLFPGMWKTAKQLERTTDLSYEMLMNQYHIAESRYRLEQLNQLAKQTKD